MKRTVFLVDSAKANEASDLLNKNGIVFSYNDRFYFDVRTAVVVGIVVALLSIIFL